MNWFIALLRVLGWIGCGVFVLAFVFCVVMAVIDNMEAPRVIYSKVNTESVRFGKYKRRSYMYNFNCRVKNFCVAEKSDRSI